MPLRLIANDVAEGPRPAANVFLQAGGSGSKPAQPTNKIRDLLHHGDLGLWTVPKFGAFPSRKSSGGTRHIRGATLRNQEMLVENCGMAAVFRRAIVMVLSRVQDDGIERSSPR